MKTSDGGGLKGSLYVLELGKGKNGNKTVLLNTASVDSREIM